MDKKNNIIKLILILSFMVIGVVGMLRLGMGDSADDKQSSTTEHHIATTTESTEEGSEDISSQLIVPETIEGDWLEGEITIPRTLEAGEDGTITITEPMATWYIDNYTLEENVDMVKEMLLQEGIEVIDLSVGEDKSLTYKFDEENLEKYITRVEREFNNALEELHCDVSIDNDFKRFVIYINEETDPMLEHGVDMIKVATWLACAQIYIGNDYKEWSVNVLTAYSENEKVLLESKFGAGEEDFVITNDTWQQMFENLEKNSTEEPTPEQEEIHR